MRTRVLSRQWASQSCVDNRSRIDERGLTLDARLWYTMIVGKGKAVSEGLTA